MTKEQQRRLAALHAIQRFQRDNGSGGEIVERDAGHDTPHFAWIAPGGREAVIGWERETVAAS